MNLNFMLKINQLRALMGKPLRITSAYRCPTYNKQVSSTGLNGPHTTGRAIDIAIMGADAFHLLEKVMIDFEKGTFTGIGINQKGDHRFIHLDDLTEKEGFPRPRLWSY